MRIAHVVSVLETANYRLYAIGLEKPWHMIRLTIIYDDYRRDGDRLRFRHRRPLLLFADMQHTPTTSFPHYIPQSSVPTNETYHMYHTN
jgi:hypothetical protein